MFLPNLDDAAYVDMFSAAVWQYVGNLVGAPTWPGAFADATHRRLRSWGLNTLANGSHETDELIPHKVMELLT
jgi:hypothetical protein